MSRGGDRDNVECKVYVGNLSPDAMEKDLEKTFGHYGPVRSVWIARNPSGFAFIEFDDHRDAEDAVRSLDGSNVCGCRVRVEMSTGKVRQKPWMRGGFSGGRDSDRAKPFNSDDKCYECGQRGHYAYDCRRSGRDNDRKSRSRSPRRTTRTKSRSKSRSRSRSRSRSKSRSRSASRDRDAGH